MGQSFILMAPGLEEVVNFHGRLSELLFDGSAAELVKLLAVPVPPVHSSLDDGRSNKRRWNDEGLSLGSQPAKRKREDLREQPTEICKRRRVQRGSELDSSYAGSKRTGIHDLATELHDLIFDHLNIVDAFSLCMSNRYFWSLGQRRIRAYFMSFMAPWANQRILCLGQDLTPGDYPPGMYTDDEKTELQQTLDEDGDPIRLWDLTSDFAQIRPSFSLPFTLLSQLVDDDTNYISQVGSYRSSVLEEARPEMSSFYPEDETWILRNLTTKEYVRSEAIALEPEHIHGPDIDFIGFGEVVLSRICWTSETSCIWMDGYDGNLKRGVWAGHRFDITTLAGHNRETKKADWRDVSNEVAEEIAKIWKSEFGSNWRQVITGAEWAEQVCGRWW